MPRPRAATANNAITVHVIFQAHLDPIWLWPWQSGLDALLATCRSACDRLDANPDIFFTRGEAWTYWQIEQVDPALFKRIAKHVAAGRWEIVGGWWIQPDCNFPSGDGLRRQMQIGKEYFLDRFGTFPKIGYNVDSFGHAATLPTLMQEAGQNRYVMMRPQEHEMPLPARLFRWQECKGKPEVITFRIAGGYTTGGSGDVSLDHVRKSITELPAGIGHTMCFMGIGDHGGGPTEKMIGWCRENRNAIEGCRLEFSTVSRFFDAVAKQAKLLPVVTGELQYHAIGCYAVGHAVKRGVRQGEQLLLQAEVALKHDPKPDKADAQRLHDAWRDICFHQFHDTIGGTCIPSAYTQAYAQIGRAHAVADEILQHSLRRQMAALPDDPLQRLVFFNASDAAFDDYLEVEPWMDWGQWKPDGQLLDERGKTVAYQIMDSEAVVNGLGRLLLRLTAKPGQLRVLRLTSGAAKSSGPAGDAVQPLTGAPMLGLHLYQDPSDTWSHGIDRYTQTPTATAAWNPPALADSGPLMACLIQKGRIGHSLLEIEYRFYQDKSRYDALLRVQWMESEKILKLTLPLPAGGVRRYDGIPGGELERPLGGRESPLANRTLIHLADGRRLGVVCPEVYALDCTPALLRLSLLRSPLMAHHEPAPARDLRTTVADHGTHDFRFRFFFGPKVNGKLLDEQALAWQRPLLYADLTRGMPTKM